MLAIKKATSDLSPYVRRAAASAIPKCHRLDSSQLASLLDLLSPLLSDLSPIVVGAAISAFNAVCPDQTDLLHGIYRRSCRMLLDLDEPGQLDMLSALHRYARSNFANPNLDSADLDPDLKLLLDGSTSVLYSRNSAIVLAAIDVYTDLVPSTNWSKLIAPILRLLKSEKESQLAGLRAICALSPVSPGLFAGCLRHLIVFPLENRLIRRAKLEAMLAIAQESNALDIWKELQVYLRSPELSLVRDAIRTAGGLGARCPFICSELIPGLMSLISKRNASLLATLLPTLRTLLLQSPSAESVRKLTTLLNLLDDPVALSPILWLAGEFSSLIPEVLPDLVRRFAKTFVDLPGEMKLQVLTAAVKSLSLLPTMEEPKRERMEKIVAHVFHLARFDEDYDVRDRARYLDALVAKGMVDILKGAKSVRADSRQERLRLGTLSGYLGRRVGGYAELPDWPAISTDSSLRKPVGEDPWTRALNGRAAGDRSPSPSVSVGVSARVRTPVAGEPQEVLIKRDSKVKKRVVNLDNWFDESDREVAADESSSEEDESESGETEESSEEEESGSDESEEESESESEGGDQVSRPLIVNSTDGGAVAHTASEESSDEEEEAVPIRVKG